MWRRRDCGFTLIELLVTVVLLGMVMAALAAAAAVILRTMPSANFRVNDARSTRSLQTWLSHDVTSTPPYVGVRPNEGGFETSAVSDPCGWIAGVNVLEMRWVHNNYTTKTEYVANYRLVSDVGDHRIVRVSCRRSGPSGGSFGTFGSPSSVSLTGGLRNDAPCPAGTYNSGYARLNDAGSNPLTDPAQTVEFVRFCFSASSDGTGFGGTDGRSVPIQLDVASRNPSEFYP